MPLFAQLEDSGCGNSQLDEGSWIDLRAPGESMHNIPVLDQDGMAFCYGYSGAVQVSAWLNLHASPNLSAKEREALVISPMIQSLQAKQSKFKCNHPCEVIDSAFELGACSANSVVFVGGGGIRRIDQPDVILEKCVRWEKMGLLRQQMGQVADAIDSDFHTQASEFEKLFAHKSFHRMTPSRQKKLSQFAVASAAADKKKGLYSYQALSAIIAPKCFNEDFKYTGNIDYKKVFGVSSQKEVQMKFPDCSFKNNTQYGCETGKYKNEGISKAAFLSEIHSAFNQKKPMPVGIDYCWTFLIDGPSTPSEDGGTCLRKGSNSQEVDHKSLLIGRRVNPTTKRCEFLLRNSWGNDCNSYSSENASSGQASYFESCNEQLSKYGTADVWIEASLLIKNVHGIQNLRSK